MTETRADRAGALSVAEFDVRGPLPGPATTTLLEASAGTGKTWAIAALVVRYVIEQGLPLERLLVVTFGRAASQELRARVRERLVEVERVLEAATADPPPARADALGAAAGDALIARILDGGPEELAVRRERARRALTDFDAATIATIHQFCQLVLRSLGVAGDTDARSELVEDLDELREQVVDDLYVAGFATSEEAPPLSRAEAGALARRVVGDPQAVLRPERATGLPEVRLRFADAVRAELQVRKRRLGVLSYDDLLCRLAEVLADPSAPARRRMRNFWQVVLVDEFQDTDPVQWQVFDRAFSGAATMVLIGDPKQAIYAFRGGDIATYATARGAAGRHATLAVNHRSDAPLVDAVTAVLRGARLGDGIEVRDVTARQRHSRLAGSPSGAPFRLRLVRRGHFADPRQPPPIGEARAVVADDLARDIAELLGAEATYDGAALRAQDVAVLCSTGPQCELVRQALAGAGVPAVVVGAGSVLGSPAALDWLTLLEALEQPHRSDRVRAAALTVFLGWSAADLALGGDRLTSELAETMREWAGLLRDRGVAAVLEVARTRPGSSARGLAGRLLGHQGGERLLTDVRHVGELLHDTAAREGLELPALLTWLRAQIADTRRDAPEDRSRRLDSDAKAVQVLTIHRSKGLQYPVVYLPFLADSSSSRDKIPLFHDEDGRRCLDLAVPPAPSSTARSEAELADEALRLLYVAMTRARSQLVTWWFPSKQNLTTAPLHRIVMGRSPGEVEVPQSVPVIGDEEARRRADAWAAAGGPVVEEVGPRAGSLGAGVPAAYADLAARPWTRHVDEAWLRTSYTRLAGAAESYDARRDRFGSEPEATAKQDEPALPLAGGLAEAEAALPSPMGALPASATFGSLVHAVLEHADPDAPERGGDLRAELRHHIDRQRIRWPVDLDADGLADALVLACRTPLGPLVGNRSLSQIRRSDRMCELDFELPLAGGDRWQRGNAETRLGELAPLLRTHLPPDDPLLSYAGALERPGYAAQPLRGYLAGSLDVVLRVQDRYVVADYKTNHLGRPGELLTSAHYAPDRLAAAMTHSSYPLQALLYAVVLHRFLRWRLSGYDPATHFGGVLYLYLRGLCGPETPVVAGGRCGVFSWQPPVALLEAVSDLLDRRCVP